jgi:hypothetical protein
MVIRSVSRWRKTAIKEAIRFEGRQDMRISARASLFLVCILLVAVVFAPEPSGRVWIQVLHNSGHGPIFGCVALLTLFVLRDDPRMSRWATTRQYAFAFIVAVALGIATELAQIPVGGDASVMDVRTDALGAVAFLALFAFRDLPQRGARAAHRTRWVALAAGLALVCVLASPLATTAAAYSRRAAAFPRIVDFSEKLDDYFLDANRVVAEHQPLPARWARCNSERALHMVFRRIDYPGLDFGEIEADWSGYQTLAIDMTNPTEQELIIELRVHDALHDNRHEDRFNTRLHVPPATRSVARIPIAEIQAAPQGRLLDVSNIAGVVIFRAKESHAPEMYLSGAWLE